MYQKETLYADYAGIKHTSTKVPPKKWASSRKSKMELPSKIDFEEFRRSSVAMNEKISNFNSLKSIDWRSSDGWTDTSRSTKNGAKKCFKSPSMVASLHVYDP